MKLSHNWRILFLPLLGFLSDSIRARLFSIAFLNYGLCGPCMSPHGTTCHLKFCRKFYKSFSIFNKSLKSLLLKTSSIYLWENYLEPPLKYTLPYICVISLSNAYNYPLLKQTLLMTVKEKKRKISKFAILAFFIRNFAILLS